MLQSLSFCCKLNCWRDLATNLAASRLAKVATGFDFVTSSRHRGQALGHEPAIKSIMRMYNGTQNVVVISRHALVTTKPSQHCGRSFHVLLEELPTMSQHYLGTYLGIEMDSEFE